MTRMSHSSDTDVVSRPGRGPAASTAASARGRQSARIRERMGEGARALFGRAASAFSRLPAAVRAALVLGLLALLALVRPEAALFAAAFIVLLIVQVPERYLVCALIAYLPFQEFLLSYVSSDQLLRVRLAPEAGVLALALALAVRRSRLIATRLRLVAVPVAVCVCVWLVAALWNYLPLSTVVIGFRSQFRFVALFVIALASTAPARDAKLYARVLGGIAAVEALLALVQFFGGQSVRAWFAPDWSIVVDGVVVSTSNAVSLETVFGTFAHRNAYADFLLFAWIVVAAAGGTSLGFRRGVGVALGTLIAVGIAISGSREAGIAFVLAAILVARVRFRFPSLRLAAAFAAVAAIAVGTLAVATDPSSEGATLGAREQLDSPELAHRWRSLLTREAWSPESNARVRILRANGGLVARASPAFGYGIGSVTDSRKLEDGSSPFYLTQTGTLAAQRGYAYDSNWTLLLVEVGFLGLAALALVFLRLGRLGTSIMREHWLGLALVGVLLSVVVVGFLTSVLLLRLPNAMLWLVSGLVVALASERARSEARAE